MKKAGRGLTRRQVAGAAAALTPLLAQDTPAKPADDLAAVREQAKRTSATLRKFRVSTLAEPSFFFKP